MHAQILSLQYCKLMLLFTEFQSTAEFTSAYEYPYDDNHYAQYCYIDTFPDSGFRGFLELSACSTHGLVLLLQLDFNRTAELKILVTFIYYAIFIGSLLGLSSVGKVGMGPAFSRSLFEYLRCEATGTMPGKVCKRSFQMAEIEIPVNIGLVLFGLYPVVNLLYVLSILKRSKSGYHDDTDASSVTFNHNGSNNL